MSRSNGHGGGRGTRRHADGDSTAEYASYFEAEYKKRWNRLVTALAQPVAHVALLNPFAGDGAALEDAVLEPFFKAPQCCCYRLGGDDASSTSYPPPRPAPATGLKPFYWLDFASVLPPLLLAPRPGQRVLDLCAAPGGKSLQLAHQLFGSSALAASLAGGSAAGEGLLVCNEPDAGRRARLTAVMDEYLPQMLRQRVRITGYDGTSCIAGLGGKEGGYDAVLVDAPCSSDRHVLLQAAARGGRLSRSDWSAARCSQLAELQTKLVTAGARALRVGGRLAYATCSLAFVENDGVVERVLQRLPPGSLRVLPADSLLPAEELEHVKRVFGLEATKHGLLSAPDTAGWGPIYVAVLEKVGATTFTPSALLPAAEESEDDSDGDGCALDGAQPEVGAVDEDDSS